MQLSESDSELVIDIHNSLKGLSENNEEIYKALLNNNMIIESHEVDDQLLDSARGLIGEPYITTAYFFITSHCNLACRYCFEKQSVPGFIFKEGMSKEIAGEGLRFFSELIKLKPEKFHEKKTIIFYGGEPLMNREVLRFTIRMVFVFISQGLLPSSTKIIVVTNGTLLTGEDIEFFLEHDVTLTFSIDGDEISTENRVYPGGKQAFSNIEESYIRCRDAGLDLNVACTLTPSTLARKEETIRYFTDKLNIKNVGFNVLLDNGLIAIPAGYDDAAAEFVAEAGKELLEHGISENRNVRRRQVFDKQRPCIFDCNAQGGRQIAIAPGGEVGICHEHITDRQHFVTDVFSEFNPAADPVYREWNGRSPLNMGPCPDCPALGICGGGCVINTERATGSIWHPDPRFCKQTLKILEMIVLQKS